MQNIEIEDGENSTLIRRKFYDFGILEAEAFAKQKTLDVFVRLSKETLKMNFQLLKYLKLIEQQKTQLELDQLRSLDLLLVSIYLHFCLDINSN